MITHFQLFNHDELINTQESHKKPLKYSFFLVYGNDGNFDADLTVE